MLVSATIADGPPRRILEVIEARRLQPVLPGLVLQELERVLVEKIGVGADTVACVIAQLDALEPLKPEAPDAAEAVSGDPADDRILAAAIAADADVFVSGDHRHLLPLRSHGGMPIVTPQTLLAQLGP